MLAAPARPSLLLLLLAAASPLAASGLTCATLPAPVLNQFSERGCCPPGEAASGSKWLPVAKLVQRLRPVRVVLLGDSLTLQTFDALRVESVLRLHPSWVASDKYACQFVPLGGPVERDCPRGMRRVAACTLRNADCAYVWSLALGEPQAVPKLHVFCVSFFVFGLPPAYLSAASLAAYRRDWPALRKKVRWMVCVPYPAVDLSMR